MATIKRDGLAEFWTTGLAKILVGDQPCQFEAWIKGHYRIDKVERSANFTQWKIDHTAQLNTAVERFKADGWKCTVERFFRVKGETAVLTGKPDLITQKVECRPTIRDIKSGAPRDSDVAQVLIYMVALPLAWGSPSMVFDGEVIYSDHSVKVTPPEAQAIRPKLFALLRKLGSDVRPEATPSPSACRFCDVSVTDCPDRFSETDENVSVSTLEF